MKPPKKENNNQSNKIAACAVVDRATARSRLMSPARTKLNDKNQIQITDPL
tara:strand:+ start:870 stop:1022 length:153 start_codon:yes stop_codon:yes gene_type:complete